MESNLNLDLSSLFKSNQIGDINSGEENEHFDKIVWSNSFPDYKLQLDIIDEDKNVDCNVKLEYDPVQEADMDCAWDPEIKDELDSKNNSNSLEHVTREANLNSNQNLIVTPNTKS